MQYVNPSVTLLNYDIRDESNMLRHIESAGRTCYKSEARITAESAPIFVEKLIQRGHLSPLEHVEMDFYGTYEDSVGAIMRYANRWPGYHCLFQFAPGGPDPKGFAVYGNARMWLDFINQGIHEETGLPATVRDVVRSWPAFFKSIDVSEMEAAISRSSLTPDLNRRKGGGYLIPVFPKYNSPHRRYSLRIVCDRGVSHELVRHRMFSFSQESTRYVKYDAMPVIETPELGKSAEDWATAVGYAEQGYRRLIENGIPAQIARSVLPNCLKTELVMTGTLSDWVKMLALRLSPAAHPQAQEIAKMISDILPEVKMDDEILYFL